MSYHIDLGGFRALILWLFGLLGGHNTPAIMVPANNADNWRHLIPGLGMAAPRAVLVPEHGQSASSTR